MAAPLRVVFVCTANVCRSAYAEVRASQLLGDDLSVAVSSAGTHGWIDKPMDSAMAAELRARGGADPSGFRSRQLTAEIVGDADLVLTAERRHRDFILDEWPAAFRRTFTLQQFADVAVAAPGLDALGLLAEAARRRKPTQPLDDVPDPYGRGPQAAAVCAARLEVLLAAIVPRLSAQGPR